MENINSNLCTHHNKVIKAYNTSLSKDNTKIYENPSQDSTR